MANDKLVKLAGVLLLFGFLFAIMNLLKFNNPITFLTFIGIVIVGILSLFTLNGNARWISFGILVIFAGIFYFLGESLSMWITAILTAILALSGIWLIKRGAKLIGFLIIIVFGILAVLNFLGEVFFITYLIDLINLLNGSSYFFPILLILAGVLVLIGGNWLFKILGILIGVMGIIKILINNNVNLGAIGVFVDAISQSITLSITLLVLGIIFVLKGTKLGEEGVGSLSKRGWQSGKKYWQKERPGIIQERAIREDKRRAAAQTAQKERDHKAAIEENQRRAAAQNKRKSRENQGELFPQ